MEAVAARQKLRRLPRRVKRLEADRAIRESRVARAGVLGKRGGLDADSALVAVRVVVLAADAADAALVAVELALVDVVEEDTRRTPIGAESDAAAGADLCGLLNGVASHTLDGLHGLPVEWVSLLRVGIGVVLGRVVTKPTSEVFAAAGG